MFNAKDINKQLKQTIEDFKNTYKATCKKSHDDYLKQFGGGARVYIPKDTEICTKEAREAFQNECVAYRHKIAEILKPVYADLETTATEAPTTDAVNAISMLQLRQNVTPAEIEMMIGRYGSNVSAYNALVSIAEKNNIYSYQQHPITDNIAAVQNLEECLCRNINAPKIVSNGFSDGLAATLALAVDNTIQPGD